VVSRGAPNRIDLPGTPEEAWESWLELRHLPVASPQAWRSVVIVAAHPDDEVLGVGGTMAMLAAGGARLRLIAVTDGEASHPGADPEATGRTRTEESADALAILGVPDIEVIRLRFPDTSLAACEDELSARLGELCAGFGVCLTPWEGDAHADHEAAGRAARRAGRRAGTEVLSYPIWMWHWAEPGDQRVPWPRARRIPLPPEVAASKRSAIGAFASQLTDREGAGPVLPSGIVAHFTREQEVLLR
jgi:LmbE family N-acetylglucosaminyl deacetylase